MTLLVRIAAALLDLVARLVARPGPPPVAAPPPQASVAQQRRFGGRVWRTDALGVHADGVLWRTPGEPVTCAAILTLFEAPLLAAAKKHGIDAALLIMTIATETGRIRDAGFTGPRTFRWEAHVLNRDVATPFRGSYSAGPMQVLATTARDIVSTQGKTYGLGYAPFALAPALAEKPATAPGRLPLYDPAVALDIGAAVIRRGLRATGDDPILVAAAYNAGGLYESGANAWRLRSHGDHLDRAARWYGDACAVLRALGMR
jgi:hypothetical protein